MIAGPLAAGPASPPTASPALQGESTVSRGPAILLSLVLLAVGACGAASPPAARTDVERGTALPPPGLNAAVPTATTTTTTVRR